MIDRSIIPTLVPRQFGWLLLAGGALLLPSCRLTDHSEREEVTPDVIQFSASGYEEVDADDLPRIAFDSTHFDMGQVVQGTQVEHRYSFRNTGGSALVISDVRGSCGCTVGKDWPKDPIRPGGTGTITVMFDSEGRSGRQDKTVTVVANTTPPSTVLTLGGEVIGPSGLEPIE